MRPALRRLLARPQSLDLLRHLLDISARGEIEREGIINSALLSCHNRRRKYASIATFVQEPEAVRKNAPSLRPQTRQLGKLHSEAKTGEIHGSRRQIFENSGFGASVNGQTVGTINKTSKLDSHPGFGKDLSVWETFLQDNGEAGVRGLWDALRSGSIVLPTEGRIADRLWTALLDLGLQDTELQGQICNYADELFKTSGKRWPLLYTHIMRSNSKGSQHDVIYWHRRLIAGGHDPGPEAFRQFMRSMVFSKSSSTVTRTIYKLNKYRNAYSKIMKTLIDQNDLPVAMEWHLFLIREGDLPRHRESHYVGSLLGYFIRLTADLESEIQRSTEKITAYIANSPINDLEDAVEHSAFVQFTKQNLRHLPPKTTVREVMNLAQGDAFHIAPKKYNDRLCARWLATTWISLDFAIKSLSALGFPMIGPLSLQAIALREPEAASVLYRISQLKDLGVWIGSSVFSRAILSFAKNGQQEYLTGLLESDQHPDSLEDATLQEKLLLQYASVGDWIQYRRTVAVQLAIARDPQALSNDIALKRHATNTSWPELLNQLEKMHTEGIPVHQVTAQYITRCLLGQRARAKRIANTRQNWQNLKMAIHILTLILERNGRVSPFTWREIFRRLGMWGRLDEVEKLSLWLASWYGQRRPAPKTGQFKPSYKRQPVSTGNRVVTLRLLFPPSFQKTITEWSFIHTKTPPLFSHTFRLGTDKHAQIEQYVQGIRLLRRLQEQGVEISLPAVKSALRNRLVVLFGNGIPLLPRNRILQAENLVTCEELVHKMNQEWGEPIWAVGTDVKGLIAKTALESMNKRKTLLKYKKRRDGLVLYGSGREPYRKPISHDSFSR